MGNGLCTHTKLTMPLKLMIIAKNVFTLKFCFLCFFFLNFLHNYKRKNKSPKFLIIFSFWTKYSFSSKFLDRWNFLHNIIFQVKDWGLTWKWSILEKVQRMFRTKDDGKMVSVTNYFTILRLTHPSSLPNPNLHDL